MIDGLYGAKTVEAVKGFQGKRQIPVTGEVDQRTLDRLRSMTRKPTTDELNNVVPKPATSTMTLDDRCLQGRVICISKAQRKLALVVDGTIVSTMDVRFGSELTPTRNGVFSVYWKSRNHVSKLYNTPMPYALFFSGGQAVHYSADFAARGYNGSSHGCVNVRNKKAVAACSTPSARETRWSSTPDDMTRVATRVGGHPDPGPTRERPGSQAARAATRLGSIPKMLRKGST
nr:L,D-transpeptidase family protein [Tessaracoccus coleopterorum]